jgi:hypothetical protein
VIGTVDLVSDNGPHVSTRPDLPEIAWAAWWEATHDSTEMRYMSCDAVVTMGRAPGCDIRIGADPIVDERVPRRWAELSWHRGRVLVANVHDRWGLALTCIDGSGVGVTAVPPGGVATAPRSSFVLDAKVPASGDDGGEGPAEFLINLSAAPTPVQPRSVEPGNDVVETTPVISLTPTQRTIGAAIIAPLAHGRARRASYDMLVHHTNYAMRTVREAVAAMDVTFVAAGLAFPGDGDALDRVAYVLGRHRLAP